MGRLFWKFFFAFWLALLIAGISVGTVVWLRHTNESHNTALDQHAGKFIQAAADIAQLGGTTALKKFLNDTHTPPLPTIYAVDKNGQELLGRKVSSQLITIARKQLKTKNNDHAVVSVISQDGQHFLLFAKWHHRLPLPVLLMPLKHRPLTPDATLPPPDDVHDSSPDFKPMPPPHFLPMPLLIASGLLAAILFSGLLAWYFTKPIKLLRQAFAAVANGDLKTRISDKIKHRHDELAELGRNFDYMTAQIDSLLSAQQRLLHDVSHELRSPLARMQAAIGLAEQQPDKLQKTLQRIERESKRIDQLVGELLILSRLETGANTKHYQDINLNQLLNETVDDARFEAVAKQLSIHCEQLVDVSMKGDAELIHRALENVLRNAIRFSPDQGCIDVKLDIDGAHQQLIITIDDQGPGVAENELKNIFEPFYRSQYVERNKSVGLGLAIAHRAINSHGGVIKACNRSEGGLHVEISLPISH